MKLILNEIFKNVNSSWQYRYTFSFLLAFVLALILIPISIVLLKRFNIMDQPNERKVHLTPIPRMGGIAVFIAFVIPMILLMFFDTAQKGIILGSAIALLIGAIDDIWGVPATLKLLALILLTLFIRQYGVITNIIFSDNSIINTVLNLFISIFWITGVCSALNAIDHMDGLAGGISLIAALAYFAVSIQTGQMFWGLLSISLAGSLLGFLVYNKHPAKIFMGDSGSFFLGFSLASIGIMGGWDSNPIKATIIPIAILSLPLCDLIYVLISRKITGTTKTLKESISYCAKDHIGHRLHKIGFSDKNTARMVYLVSGTIAISALILRNTKILGSFLLLLQMVLIYIMLVALMQISSTSSNTGKQDV
ncbi:MAG: MraY family glycosyltransferase [Verrucomicrobiota bacterium]|nr:MraY family glycosyltransferase [Verrucomicrobiota bacterium]